MPSVITLTCGKVGMNPDSGNLREVERCLIKTKPYPNPSEPSTQGELECFLYQYRLKAWNTKPGATPRAE
jgi:hypothetical protein